VLFLLLALLVTLSLDLGGGLISSFFTESSKSSKSKSKSSFCFFAGAVTAGFVAAAVVG